MVLILSSSFASLVANGDLDLDYVTTDIHAFYENRSPKNRSILIMGCFVKSLKRYRKMAKEKKLKS